MGAVMNLQVGGHLASKVIATLLRHSLSVSDLGKSGVLNGNGSLTDI